MNIHIYWLYSIFFSLKVIKICYISRLPEIFCKQPFCLFGSERPFWSPFVFLEKLSIRPQVFYFFLIKSIRFLNSVFNLWKKVLFTKPFQVSPSWHQHCLKWMDFRLNFVRPTYLFLHQLTQNMTSRFVQFSTKNCSKSRDIKKMFAFFHFYILNTKLNLRTSIIFFYLDINYNKNFKKIYSIS